MREVEVEREEEEEKKKKTAVIEWLSKRSLAFSSRYFRGALSNSSICDLQWRERVGPRPARQETQGKAVETGSILLAEKAATAQSFSCPVAPSKKKKNNESPPLPPPPQTHVDHGRRQDLVRRQRPQRCLHAVPGRQSDNGRLLGREHRGDLRLDQELAELFVSAHRFVARWLRKERNLENTEAGMGGGRKKEERKREAGQGERAREIAFRVVNPSVSFSTSSVDPLVPVPLFFTSLSRLPSPFIPKQQSGEKKRNLLKICNFGEIIETIKTPQKNEQKERKKRTARKKKKTFFFRRALPWLRPSYRPPLFRRRRALRRARRSA